MITLTLYPRTKFLVIALFCMFSGLIFLKFGFKTPPAVKTTEGSSIVVIKDMYTGLTNTQFINTNVFSLTENINKPMESVYNYNWQDENNFLPKNVNLRR